MKTNFEFSLSNLEISEKMKIENINVNCSVEVDAAELIEIYKGEKELFELLSATAINVMKELNKK